MSDKPKPQSRSREYNVESNRNAMPYIWIFGYGALAAGVLMLGAGLIWNLHAFVTSSPLILVAAGIILRIGFKGRQQIKEFDAQKKLDQPAE
jgi:hypothetical protein